MLRETAAAIPMKVRIYWPGLPIPDSLIACFRVMNQHMIPDTASMARIIGTIG